MIESQSIYSFWQNNLPPELMVKISTYFDSKTHYCALQVCKSWHQALQNDVIWKWRAQQLELTELYQADTWQESLKMLIMHLKILEEGYRQDVESIEKKSYSPIRISDGLTAYNRPLTFPLVRYFFRKVLAPVEKKVIKDDSFADGTKIIIKGEMMSDSPNIQGVDQFGRSFFAVKIYFKISCMKMDSIYRNIVTVSELSSRAQTVALNFASLVAYPKYPHVMISQSGYWMHTLRHIMTKGDHICQVAVDMGYKTCVPVFLNDPSQKK